MRRKKRRRTAAPPAPRAVYLLFDEPLLPVLPLPPELLLVDVLPPPVLVELPTLLGLAVPPLIEVPALPMPLEPCRLLEPLCPVEP